MIAAVEYRAINQVLSIHSFLIKNLLNSVLRQIRQWRNAMKRQWRTDNGLNLPLPLVVYRYFVSFFMTLP